jgi:hypothetical protein
VDDWLLERRWRIGREMGDKLPRKRATAFQDGGSRPTRTIIDYEAEGENRTHKEIQDHWVFRNITVFRNRGPSYEIPMGF